MVYAPLAQQALALTLGQPVNVPVSAPPIGLSAFKQQFWPHYQHCAHQALLDSHLERVARYIKTGGEQGIGRLMVFMPPRHGKTLTVSRLFPAWILGMMPDLSIIMSSYAQRLATRNSKFVRNAIESARYDDFFPGITLSDDTAAANEWTIAGHAGGALAAGVGGGITGHGGKLLIIDDPIRNRADAESDVYRDRVWDWYTDDALTRVEEPGGAIVLMHTRWHTDDLAGRILRSEDAGAWTVLDLPALAFEGDLLGRAPDEALWPERYPVEVLERRRRDMGDYSFNAEYQQRPVASQGGLFKRDKFNIINHAPADIVKQVRFWDLAMSEKTSADYTDGLLMGMTAGGRLVILDNERVQVDWDDVEPFIAKRCIADTPAVRVGVEAAFYQTKAVQKLLKRPELHSFSIRGYKPDTDKFTRALPFAARVGEGLVDVLRRSWTEPLIEELCSFPYGAHDDQVDACSGAYLMLETNTTATATARRYA